MCAPPLGNDRMLQHTRDLGHVTQCFTHWIHESDKTFGYEVLYLRTQLKMFENNCICTEHAQTYFLVIIPEQSSRMTTHISFIL